MLTLPGSQYLATHIASVLSILGSSAPPVRSYGAQFQNKDRWTIRYLIQELCLWSKENPNQPLTEGALRKLLDTVNATPPVHREITIAATPEKLTPPVAMALIGGAYHEAWHSLYSCKDNLAWERVSPVLLRLAKLKNWGVLSSMLLDWSNIIEDIRIERRGTEQFPGAMAKMYDLQDFILNQEVALRDKWTPYHTLQATFRDAGLGYVTSTSQAAFDFYQITHPDMFKFVTCGPLRKLLDETLALTAQDDLACLRIAIDVVLLFINLAAKQKQTSGEVKCPQCGAPPSAILQRPHAQTLQLVQLCTVCGYIFPTTPPHDSSVDNTLEEKSPEDSEGAEGSDSSRQDGTDSAEKEREAPKPKAWADDTIAQVVLDSAQQKDRSPLQDFPSAMGMALQDLEGQEQSKLADNEDFWRPYAPDLDRLLVVPPGDVELANQLLSEARQQTAFLQARLRNILLARRIVEVEHGAQKGTQLSARNLVSTKVSLLAGEDPKHAFLYAEEGYQVSFAAVLLVDQSASMMQSTAWMARCLFTLALPLDLLRCPLCIAGFQVGCPPQEVVFDKKYHRSFGVDINLFKDFPDTLRSSLARLVNIQTAGGTPMADGIQFGLHALQKRQETHRVLFVITDGLPERGQLGVIHRQQRIMKKMGIHCIGVGVGEVTKPLRRIFREALWASSFEQLPQELLRKLSDLLHPSKKRRKA